MLGNESLREGFAIGPPSDEIAREYLHWLRHTRRRTALTVYQYARKLERFLEWVNHDALSTVDAPQRHSGRGTRLGPTHINRLVVRRACRAQAALAASRLCARPVLSALTPT
jgi:hypothetical protein